MWKERLDVYKRQGIYTDDKPNEKCCSYDSVGDSYEHHSRFLKENSRYAQCFALSPDDYKGWTQNIEQAGYATGGEYAESLQRIIAVSYTHLCLYNGSSQRILLWKYAEYIQPTRTGT